MKKSLPIVLLLVVLCSFGNMRAQNTTARTVLLEEKTGTWCGWCPYGADSVEAITQRMPNVAALAYHNGDPMATAETQLFIDSTYNGSYPTAYVDRLVWQVGVGQYAFALDRGVWGAACAARTPVGSPMSIVVDSSTYDPVTRQCSFICKFTALSDMTGEYYYTLVISEDDVNYEQLKYLSGGGQTMLNPYYHQRVVRKMPLTAFGSRLTNSGFTAGQTVRRTYNYTIPPTVTWDLTKCHLTVIVNKHYPGIIGQWREVQQAWQKDFFDALILLPVKLVAFNAERVGTDVKLVWRTDGESNNKGWAIERRHDLADWKQIDFVTGRGTTAQGAVYEYLDRTANQSGIYDYRLRQTDYDGTQDVSPVARVTMNAMPLTTKLHQNYPNPFNPTTQLTVDLASATTMTLEVFDAVGRKLATVANGEYEAGTHFFDWNGQDLFGMPLPSGMYFYRLSTPGHVETRQMTIAR